MFSRILAKQRASYGRKHGLGQRLTNALPIGSSGAKIADFHADLGLERIVEPVNVGEAGDQYLLDASGISVFVKDHGRMDLPGQFLSTDLGAAGAVKRAQQEKIVSIDDSNRDGVGVDLNDHGGTVSFHEAKGGE